ncbi:MAG: PspC domain-containing protein, partial [Pseudomonadales bacterium]
AGAIGWVLSFPGVESLVTDEYQEHRGEDSRDAESELSAAAQRLEEAVERLVRATTSHLSDTVVTTVEATVDRVRAALDSRRSRSHRSARRSRRRYYARPTAYRGVAFRGERKLYRDPSRKKIAGVCAGLSDYFGTDPWVIRCIALCLLFFTPLSGVTFMAYWVAYFVMDVKPSDYDMPGVETEPMTERPRRRRGRRRRRDEQIAARADFRNVKTSFGEIESRLRSMESYVTSTQFELQRELSKISDAQEGNAR